MRLPKQCVLVLTAINTVISATPAFNNCPPAYHNQPATPAYHHRPAHHYQPAYHHRPARSTVTSADNNDTVISADNNDIPLDIPICIRRIFFQGKSYRPLPPFPKPPTFKCECQYHVTCAYQLDEIRQSCYLPSGGIGVCCPPFRGGRPGKKSVLPQYYPSQPVSNVSEEHLMDMVNKSSEEGIKKYEEFIKNETVSCRNGMTLEPLTAAFLHLRVFRTCNETRELQKKAQIHAEASMHLAKSMGINGYQLNVDAEKYNSTLRNNCLKIPNCPNPMSKYRTAGGECNNLKNPEWGMSKTELWRLLPPTYFGGIFLPRNESVLGGKLPLVRVVANTILPDMDKPDLRYTLSVMQWAQFLDHDLSLSPFPDMPECEDLETEDVPGEGEPIRCCTEDDQMLGPKDFRHPSCMPIEIPKNDSFYSQNGRNVTCLTFVRSNIVCPFETKCRFKHVEQINKLTHWIDGSVVYGQNQTDQDDLRAFDNGTSPGLLKTSSNNFLPLNSDASSCDNTRGACYLAGESRVNEQPGLTMLHTIWMRQHNLIAKRLYDMNRHWTDETVFQETRRIIAAQITHITYNEWLPIIIGETFMAKFDLLPQRKGYTSDYDPTINANINNGFSTAAFRFGHSLVQGLIKLFRAQGKAIEVLETNLRDNFLTGRLITLPGFFDGVLRGLTRQGSQRMDNFVTDDLKNHLYQVPSSPDNFGMDLMSLNIQRGRDHGIGTYNDARALCNLGRAKNFHDITDTISPSIVEKLKDLYAHVDDIDLFVGGMAETSYWYQGGDGILGPTFRCIVGDQFARLKIADRYYYELEGQAGQFTLEQLDQIRLTSWARIICDNSENLDVIQPLAFRYPNHNNLLGPCNNSPNIPQIDLKPWHDDK